MNPTDKAALALAAILSISACHAADSKGEARVDDDIGLRRFHHAGTIVPVAGFQFGAQFGNSGILGDRCAADAEGAARQGGKGQFTLGCGVTQGMTPAQASAQGQRGFRQVQLGGAAQSQCDGTQVLALRVATQSGLATRFAKGAVTQLMPVHAGIGFYAGARADRHAVTQLGKGLDALARLAKLL